MERVLTRHEASEAVEKIGWRLLLGSLCTAVTVTSVTQGADVAVTAASACGSGPESGPDTDRRLRIDVRPDRVILTLQSPDRMAVTDIDVQLAHRISAVLPTHADIGTDAPHSLQVLELAIDALDIPAIQPFWKAVFGYVSEPGSDGPTAALVDPYRQGPAIWFQQMDQERPQRNRIHFDLCVSHDEAERRVAAALAVGGRLLSDGSAPAFWVLADPEGNEICVTTWQGRDS